MKKKVLAGLIGTMLVSSVGFAAPVVNLEEGKTIVGVHQQSFDVEGEDFDSLGFSVKRGLTDTLVVGLEYGKLDDAGFKTTDIFGQYKVSEKANVVLGLRQYKFSDGDSESQILLGVNGSTKIGEKATGYAGLLFTEDETEWQIGATYDVTENVILDVNYKNRGFDDFDMNGIGFGVGYKF